MLTEFNHLLTSPELYACAYRDGAIFFDLISLAPG
jgi:hypothetical protein